MSLVMVLQKSQFNKEIQCMWAETDPVGWSEFSK